MNELRRDYFTGYRVIIATERAKRPSDFVKAAVRTDGGICPFCPGNEHLTPPGKAVYIKDGESACIESDIEGQPRKTGWITRVIPNLFPAVKPYDMPADEGQVMPAAGVHEVIVETPVHDRHPQSMPDEDIRALFAVYRDRFEAAARLPYVKYVSVFRNNGKDAGASLAHPHSQVIAVPVIPEPVKGYIGKNFSRVLEKEEASERRIISTKETVAFAPYASRGPYEVWVFPRKPRKNIAGLTACERDDMAVVVRDVLARMSRMLGDPSYNYCFFQSIEDGFHMHVRILPRLTLEAGFELNTGININPVPPEHAAKSLNEI